LAFDGTGYGDDGKVWGAETLVADLTDYRRVGRLRYAPLPGGDLAVRHPWRVALGYLSLAPELAPAFRLAFDGVPHRELAVAERQISHRLNAPLASSMGRLFDAAAAVLGTRRDSHYEGQAAMELEALAGERDGEPLPFPVREGRNGCREMDPLPLLAALGERAARGENRSELAARFHESVAAASSGLAIRACEENGLSTVALGGGVFQNARLLTSLRRRLESRGLRVLVPRQLSPNDGAISYGQAAVAASVLRAELNL
jgi:hydrogenase maturation protein HypF